MIKAIGKMTLAGLLAAIVLGVPVGASAQDATGLPASTNAPATGTNSIAKPKAKSHAKTKKAVTTDPTAKAAKPAKAGKATNFSGKLAAIDKQAKTITLDDKDKRVFQMTSETKILKGAKGDEKPATLEDGTVGEHVTGSWLKSEDGKMSLKSLYFRGESAPKKAGKKAAAKTTEAKPAGDK